MKRYLLTTALAGSLLGCSASNPFTDNNATNAVNNDPNVNANQRFLFDTSKNLTANQFTYDPATDRITINNLPFDGVSASGGQFSPQGVVLPNGTTVYGNTPGAGEDKYYAVILRTPAGTGALVGAVATDAWRDFGYGGAYAERPSAGLPAARTAAYQYRGNYAGVRVLRHEGGTVNKIQLTEGIATLDVDLQDLDNGGSIRGRITNRQLYEVDGTPRGALETIILNSTTIDATNMRSNAATADTLHSGTPAAGTTAGTVAQTGSWEGNFSGPNGEEIVGYVLIEGDIADRDPEFVNTPKVKGREIGGFIATQQP